MIDRLHVAVVVSESAAATADELDLLVYAFQRAVADPPARPRQNAGLASAHHPSQVLEGSQPHVSAPPEPLAEIRSITMQPILFFLLSAFVVLLTSTGTVWSHTTEPSLNGQEQIDWLIEQQDLYTTGLVDSYEDGDNDEAWIYDEALAIIAFTKAGELDRARMILDRMEGLQLGNGAWYEAYHAENASAVVSALHHITGPIAWMVMAIDFYEHQTADSSYAPTARNALDWMDTMRNTNPADERYGSLRFSISSPDVISTEHNLDAYSAYYWRGMLDSNNSYIDKANLVLDYLRTEMWAPSPQSNGPYHDVNVFWEGWGNFAFSTDPQSWGVLSLGPVGPDSEEFAASLDWIWWAPYGNTRTIQDYNSGVLDVEGVKSGTGEPTKYIWVEATDGVASAYYNVGDNVRGEHFHRQMARTVAANGGLVHSFCEVDPDDIRWPENFRHNHVASVAWHYFNRETPRINPFRPSNLPPGIPAVGMWGMIVLCLSIVGCVLWILSQERPGMREGCK